MVVFSSTVSLPIFCLLGLSVTDRGVLKTPTVIVDSSVSSCGSISICLTHFVALLLRVYTLRIVNVFLENLPLYHSVILLFISDQFSCSEVCSV